MKSTNGAPLCRVQEESAKYKGELSSDLGCNTYGSCISGSFPPISMFTQLVGGHLHSVRQSMGGWCLIHVTPNAPTQVVDKGCTAPGLLPAPFWFIPLSLLCCGDIMAHPPPPRPLPTSWLAPTPHLEARRFQQVVGLKWSDCNVRIRLRPRLLPSAFTTNCPLVLSVHGLQCHQDRATSRNHLRACVGNGNSNGTLM